VPAVHSASCVLPRHLPWLGKAHKIGVPCTPACLVMRYSESGAFVTQVLAHCIVSADIKSLCFLSLWLLWVLECGAAVQAAVQAACMRYVTWL
jgi:hypothetical protein